MKTMRWILACLTAVWMLLPGDVFAQTYSRKETISYHDDTDRWVLGQVATVTCVASVPLDAACDGNDLVSATTFDPTYAHPVTSSAFGKLQYTLAYDTTSSIASAQRGTLVAVTDGGGHATALSSWKGGVPRTIVFADNMSQSATVDDYGQITSVTDENGAGYTTSYGYDAMGRLSSIAYPAGDTVVWNATTRTFAQIASAEYGIPAGHWRLTESVGNARTETYYDAFWRPLLVRRYDAAIVAATDSYAASSYDIAGNKAYTGYPVSTAPTSSGGQWTVPGTRTAFDALGRPLSVKQDSELGVLTTTLDYQSGFKVTSTNPRGNATTTSYQAYDEPVTDWPVLIAHPAGAWTHIVRDAFGKPTRIRRSNSSSPTGGTLAVNRDYTYNAYQELCRAVEPETGATLYGYDGAGNLKWSSAGLGSTQACEASGTSGPVAARRVDRTYDARNRVSTLTFPDSNGNQSWAYTPDGLPASVTTYNDAGTTSVVNGYAYNKRRLLTAETSSQPGWYTWSVGYTHDANGHVASQTYPDGVVVSYTPNALGQPTQAGTYATGVSYFPNGAIKQFTYGNGIVHTLTQNTRQLPLRSRDADGSTSIHDDTYAYDPVGNVASIADGVAGNRGNRSMTYDALDRLTDTTSPMYGTTGAHYTYDVLDNVTRTTAPGRDQADCYDATNRLTKVAQATCSGSTILTTTFDVQGNLATWNALFYGFDYGNRLREITGQEYYRYDALGRRVLAWTPTQGNILSMYTQAGQLAFQQNQRNGTRNLDYVSLGGSLVATRSQDVGTGAVTLTWQHTDALGSPVATTDSSKTVVQRSEYEPYGKLLNRPLKDGPGYTGHVTDAATQLVYMQQRYYDPRVARFWSTDPVTALSGPFNRYWYAANNPYVFTDPDGRQDCRSCDVFGDQFKRDAEAGNMRAYEPLQIPALVVTAAMLVGPAAAALFTEAGAGATLVNAGGAATTTTGGLMAASEAAGGHMLARHVGLSTEQLAARLAADTGIKAASTFTNVTTAEASLNSALAANQGNIASWLGGSGGGRLVIQGITEGPVGSVMVRGANAAMESSAGQFVLQRTANMATGFRVITGYPIP